MFNVLLFRLFLNFPLFPDNFLKFCFTILLQFPPFYFSFHIFPNSIYIYIYIFSSSFLSCLPSLYFFSYFQLSLLIFFLVYFSHNRKISSYLHQVSHPPFFPFSRFQSLCSLLLYFLSSDDPRCQDTRRVIQSIHIRRRRKPSIRGLILLAASACLAITRTRRIDFHTPLSNCIVGRAVIAF